MFKIYQILYNSNPYTRGLEQAATNLPLGMSSNSWEKIKAGWMHSLKKGEMAEMLFLVAAYDTDTGNLTVLENTYVSSPLRVKRVINSAAKETQVTSLEEEEVVSEDNDD